MSRPSPLDSATVDRLLEAARQVRKSAHAPYSGFHVGAALLVEDGRIFVGCNVENASYGLGVCAERNAVAAAIAAGAGDIRAIAVVTSADPPASPCGACRQVLAEFGDFEVLIADLTALRDRTWVLDLLPRAFLPSSLE